MNPKDKQKDIATDVDYIDPSGTDIDPSSTLDSKPKRKRGRPRKTDIAAKKTGNRGKVGRPKGDAAIINEYKARMLNSPKSRQVLEAIFDAALDDEHKNQSAAWKLVMDRMLPVSYFEKDKENGGRNAVNITISGVGGESITIGGNEDKGSDDVLEGDYRETD